MNRVGGVTMANIKSAKKRVRVNAVKAEQNKALKSELKTAIKKADPANKIPDILYYFLCL